MDELPAEIHDPKLDDTQLTKLANELASGTFPPHIVLKTFNLTLSQFEKYVAANPYFKRTYDTAVLDWNSANSAVKRIKIKSAMSLERGLRTLHDRMNNAAETLPAVVETAKLLANQRGIYKMARQMISLRFASHLQLEA